MADPVYSQFQSAADYWPDTIPYIMEGQVVDVADPDQMGRVRIWVPGLDGETYDISSLPWADYASPFAGFTVEYPAGEAQVANHSHAAYGFWAIPKVGATVLVFFLNGNPASRFFFASTLRLHRNRSLPAGRNVDGNGKAGPWGDAGDGTGNLNPIEPAYTNLRTQFQNKTDQSEAQTRGAYERNVAQAKTEKDGSEGYSANPADPSYLDPQTYCIVTPGRHAIIMQDDPNWSRLRFKTAEGHQIIFDDANERIYVSTARGNSWFEMDQDGHINAFGAQSISFRSGVDLNFFADGDINFEAGGGINIKADTDDIMLTGQANIQIKANGSILAAACGKFHLDTEDGFALTAATTINIHAKQAAAITADQGMDLKAGAGLKAQGADGVDIKGGPVKVGGSTVDINGGSAITASAGTINLNGPGAASPSDATAATDADCPDVADSPPIVPGFEPWTRPVSDTERGPYWQA